MMKTIDAGRTARLLLGMALMAAAALAQAQYIWLDAKGLRQYSDRAPPPSVPQRNILKAPGGPLPPDTGAASAAEPAAEKPGEKAGAAPRAPQTTAERETDYRKRKLDAAEKDKKDADAERAKRAAASNCNSLRATQRNLESGRRLGITDKNGATAYMDDAERARQTAEVRGALADCQ